MALALAHSPYSHSATDSIKLRRRHAAYMQNLAGAHEPDVARLERGHRQGLPGAGDEFHLVRLGAVVDVDHGPDIAGSKFVVRHVARQHDNIVLTNRHG